MGAAAAEVAGAGKAAEEGGECHRDIAQTQSKLKRPRRYLKAKMPVVTQARWPPMLRTGRR